MPKTQNKPITHQHADAWVEAVWKFFVHCYRTIIELAYGVWTNSIPWIACCSVGVLFAILISLQMDIRISKQLDVFWLYPTHPILYWSYCFFATTLGFWIWALN